MPVPRAPVRGAPFLNKPKEYEMATFTDRDFIDLVIRNGGKFDDDPQILRIVEYTGAQGETLLGVVWVNEPVSINRYLRESEYIRNPRVIWQHPDL